MEKLSVNDAAKRAGVTANTVYHWVADKKIPFEKVPVTGAVLIPVDAFDAFVAVRPMKPGPRPASAEPTNGASATLTVREAAKMANVASATIAYWHSKGHFKSERIGPNRTVDRKGFLAYLATYQAGGGNPLRRPGAKPRKPRGSAAEAPAAGDEKNYLTAAEAAARLRVQVTTVYRLIAEKRFKSTTQGRKRLIDRASLEAFASTYVNHKAAKHDTTRQGEIPFNAVRALARGEERAAEFGGQAPRADSLAALDMAQQIGSELGSALSNYRKHVLRKFLTEALEKLDREG